MKQIIQNMKTGDTILEEVPAPIDRSGHLLIQTRCSLVSLGTEKMLVEFGNASLIQKARQQPDKVKMVLDKIRSDGLLPTLEAVFNKLGQPLPLGYCNVGQVLAVGNGVTEFQVGDRVASNGPHAEVVCVPKNLCARIPENVSDEEAAFTVIGSIGLQGIRLLQPVFGETVVVVGLGLIGLISAQILRANGCRVIGFDFDQTKVELAKQIGIIAVNPADGTDQVKYVLELTGGIGADAVLITASAKSNEIISQSARMSRKRGRIVLVGVIGLDISRAEFYEKELTFQVSCSYGPGRYDEQYEQRGNDYPIGFVRWTEKRNFEAILQAVSSGQLQVGQLITERVPLEDYLQIYGNIGQSGSIASILQYPVEAATQTAVSYGNQAFSGGRGVIAIVGAGNFTSAAVLPALKPLNANLKYIISAGGLSASILAKRAGIAIASTNYHDALIDPEVDLVMILTRHNQHASMVVDALKAGKNVFVEKPLCLNSDELALIEETYRDNVVPGGGPVLTVGFNRRFAPFVLKMKSFVGSGAMNIVATMNAGFIPANSWVHDLEVGGGRIIGEACHFIDLCSFLCSSKVVAVCMNSLGTAPQKSTDNASILLRYANGSNAVINYFANGSKSYAKERVEVHSQERSLILDNWRSLTGFGFKNFTAMKTKQDKGHAEQFRQLLERARSGGAALIPFDEIVNTTRACFAAIISLKEARWVEVSEE